jgi:energy-coupling factor transporter ATP-binding protein EcfA2
MDLLSITLTGFKRFRKSTSLQTNGKLIAILGPNEAGKSSLLEALTYLNDGEELPVQAISRGGNRDATKIKATYYLDEHDRMAANLSESRRVDISKVADGTRYFGFTPPAPDRDIDHRPDLRRGVVDLLEDSEAAAALSSASADIHTAHILALEALDSNESDLSPAELKALKVFGKFLESLKNALETEKAEVISTRWDEVLALEHAPNPARRAISALMERMPRFLLFDDAARDLRSTYTMSELRSGVPVALANILDIAKLKLSDVFAAIDRGDNPARTTLERRASATLSRKFSKAWRQSGLSVSLSIQSDILEVQIVDQDQEYTAFAERSDGLRQFVALCAFATRKMATKPILLIDEAEQRLHYDAQADLVQMLAKQNVAPKVIYTTHSAGCLPEDLGNGVRMVKPIEDGTASRIVSRFWAADSAGFAPLLYGMGATTLAFFPTRKAVMVEGPSDMLLYPTIFREALGVESLGFQFVPGLSNIEQTMTREAFRVEVGLAYLVDGDDGGGLIATGLKRKGVNAQDIFIAKNPSGSAVELEDFIEPGLLVKATNKIIDRYHEGSTLISRKDLSADQRMADLERLFETSTGRPLPKVDLAYELLDMANASKDIRLLDPRRRQTIVDLAKAIGERLGEAQQDR